MFTVYKSYFGVFENIYALTVVTHGGSISLEVYVILSAVNSKTCKSYEVELLTYSLGSASLVFQGN